MTTDHTFLVKGVAWKTSIYLASFPVLHHSYRRLQLLFILQATIAMVED